MRARLEKEQGEQSPLKAAFGAYYDIDFAPLERHRLSCSEPIMVDNRDVATWPERCLAWMKARGLLDR